MKCDQCMKMTSDIQKLQATVTAYKRKLNTAEQIADILGEKCKKPITIATG